MLVEGLISGFRFYFTDEETPFMHFSTDTNGESVVGRLSADVHLEHLGLRLATACPGLGFSAGDTDLPELRYPVAGFRDAWGLKIILSRLIYEVMEPYCRRQTGHLVYDQPGT
ncbi:hypothetical protein C7T94_06345 [Pedobacter yulinensis]|uniref:Uncharacterized protein n=1 Tax=Pedobacter yulinensis TaxID=2126353 RepID=A0A2T3HPG2_9SPHI|nr:hypothetical protein C7T94_06345 [Pedobacter yulinensis]